MARIAADLDGSRVTGAIGWHSALLRRMANAFPDVCDPVISPACYSQLDRLRAFRHRERNSYGLDLDLDIVARRGAEAVVAVATFHGEVSAFFARLESENPDLTPSESRDPP